MEEVRILPAVLLALSPLAASAEEPWSADARHPVVPALGDPAPSPARRPSVPARAMRALVGGYQRHVSAHDGPHCRLYPTCSDFSRQAFARHGFVLGLLLTVDRLVQEMEVERRAPPILAWGRVRGFDPVEAEDFWWARSRLRTPLPPRRSGKRLEHGFRTGPRPSGCGCCGAVPP